MKVTLVMVMSVNGKVTNGSDPYIASWTSTEDKNHFATCIANNNLILMGRKTYIAAKPFIQLDPNKLRVVLTRTPKKYASQTVIGQLEFSNEPPPVLLNRLSIAGYQQALLVGGSTINTLFLNSNNITECLITIEPYLFGKGKELFSQRQLYGKLQLTSITKVNKKGTLIVTYKII